MCYTDQSTAAARLREKIRRYESASPLCGAYKRTSIRSYFEDTPQQDTLAGTGHISFALLKRIEDQYRLNFMGLHGLPHWSRVMEFGLKLAETTGASRNVIELFAIFHDAYRRNESVDPLHGLKGAELVRQLHNEYFQLAEDELELLCRACAGHTGGRPEDESDITVLTCWDADRLDLPRVGKIIDPERLCTDTARNPELIAWASDKSTDNKWR